MFPRVSFCLVIFQQIKERIGATLALKVSGGDRSGIVLCGSAASTATLMLHSISAAQRANATFFFTLRPPSSANGPILLRLLALLRRDLTLNVILQLAEILLQAVHHAAAILHLHTVKHLPHTAHIGLRGLHAEIAAELGIASVVMDTGVDDLTGERRKDLAVD